MIKKNPRKDLNHDPEKNLNPEENLIKVLLVQDIDTVKIVKNPDRNRNQDQDPRGKSRNPLVQIQQKDKAFEMKTDLGEGLMMNMITDPNSKDKCIYHLQQQLLCCLLEERVFQQKLMYMSKI